MAPMCDAEQEYEDLRTMDADMSYSDSGIETPSWSDFEKLSETDYVPTVPRPGKVFMIHLRDTDKVITINEGEVVLQSQDEAEPGGGWYWACVEKGNWFGFRNTVSGSYLGHNGKSGLDANATHHKAHQFLCMGHHSHGGYLLLVKSPGGEEMRQVGCSADVKTLVENEKDGAQWMFEEVCAETAPPKKGLPKKRVLKTAARIMLELIVLLNALMLLEDLLPDFTLPVLLILLFIYFRV